MTRWEWKNFYHRATQFCQQTIAPLKELEAETENLIFAEDLLPIS